MFWMKPKSPKLARLWHLFIIVRKNRKNTKPRALLYVVTVLQSYFPSQCLIYGLINILSYGLVRMPVQCTCAIKMSAVFESTVFWHLPYPECFFKFCHHMCIFATKRAGKKIYFWCWSLQIFHHLMFQEKLRTPFKPQWNCQNPEQYAC